MLNITHIVKEKKHGLSISKKGGYAKDGHKNPKHLLHNAGSLMPFLGRIKLLCWGRLLHFPA